MLEDKSFTGITVEGGDYPPILMYDRLRLSTIMFFSSFVFSF